MEEDDEIHHYCNKDRFKMLNLSFFLQLPSAIKEEPHFLVCLFVEVFELIFRGLCSLVLCLVENDGLEKICFGWKLIYKEILCVCLVNCKAKKLLEML